MSKFFKSTFVLALLFSTLYQVTAQSNSDTYFAKSKEDAIHLQNIEKNLTPFYALKGKVLTKSIPQLMLESNIPGMCIAFVDKGEIAWMKSYGYANLEKMEKVTLKSVFEAGSVSKPVTTMAALGLVEDGILGLDEDVDKRLVGWKLPESKFTKEKKVTLAGLIGHTSGIGNGIWRNYMPGEKMPTVEQLLEGKHPSNDPALSIDYVPGTKLVYSNPAYLLLEELMTDVTKRRFNDIIKDRVFEPSGMKNSSFVQPIREDLAEMRTVGYTEDLRPHPYEVYPYQAPGAMWTTAEDLGKFAIAVISDYKKGSKTILDQSTMEKVFTRDSLRLGFSKWIHKDDIVFRHTGQQVGYCTFFQGSLDKEQAFVIMTNSDVGAIVFGYLMRAISKEYDWDYFQPEVYKPITMAPEKIRSFTGSYRVNNEKTFEFVMKKDSLYVKSDDLGGLQKLVPIGDNLFLLPSIPYKFTFEKNQEGLIDTVGWRDQHGDYRPGELINGEE